MQTQFGFTSFFAPEFETWIAGISVARTVNSLQQHHTWLPSYANFTGSNHFTMQKNMKHHHVANNGWSDIGQHFTIFPDGVIMTGRPLNKTPACIFGNNTGAICFESVGDFDTGRDQMRTEQRDTIIRATRAVLARFTGIAKTDRGIVYHHWFDLNSGARTDGAGVTKSCPGTGYFGGNTVAAFNANFLPLVLGQVPAPVAPVTPAAPLVLVAVTATFLNIRTGPATSFAKITDQGPAELGSILRVWSRQNGWLKVSNSKEHWVFGIHTEAVLAGTINAADTNARSGPGTSHGVIDVYGIGRKVHVRETSGSWSRVGTGVWVHTSLITMN